MLKRRYLKNFNLIICFKRIGIKKNAIYHIVVTKSNFRTKSSFIEKLGYYIPNFVERRFSINSMRLAY